ncbi:MAG: hypothetical protein ACXACK_13550 [Candidatus Hodarchaeales archaeon]|jgi:hypothetical protein
MSKKKDCSCGKHKKGHHEEMSQPETIDHVIDCLGDVIDRLECIKEAVKNITPD